MSDQNKRLKYTSKFQEPRLNTKLYAKPYEFFQIIDEFCYLLCYASRGEKSLLPRVKIKLNINLALYTVIC